jgi:hypothetical protein
LLSHLLSLLSSSIKHLVRSAFILQTQEINAIAQLECQMYGAGLKPWYPSLLAFVLLFLFCLVWIWQRKKHLCGAQSRPPSMEDHEFENLDWRFPENINRGDKYMSNCGKRFRQPIPLSTTRIDEACLAELLPLRITSGQLAATVRRQNQQGDIEQIDTDIMPDRLLPQPRHFPSSPKRKDEEGNTRKIEHESIEFYYRSDVQEIWSRRVLAIVGQ